MGDIPLPGGGAIPMGWVGANGSIASASMFAFEEKMSVASAPVSARYC